MKGKERRALETRWPMRVRPVFIDPLEQLELGRLRGMLPVYVTGVEIVEGVLR